MVEYKNCFIIFVIDKLFYTLKNIGLPPA